MSATPSPLLSLLVGRQQFHELSLRARVVLSHLPLCVSVALTGVLAAVFFPDVLSNPHFIGGLVGFGVLWILSAVVPWDRLPYPSYWVIPLLDFVAIGFLRQGGGTELAGIGLLAVFPVFWMAWSEIAPAAARLISFVAPLLIVWIPVFAGPEPVTPQAVVGPLLIPMVTLTVSVTASVFALSSTAQQQALAHKDRELRALLEDSKVHVRRLDTVLNAVAVGVLVTDANGQDILSNVQQQRDRSVAMPQGIENPNEADLLVFEADRVTPFALEDRPIRRAVRGETFSDVLVWIGAGESQRAMLCTARPMQDDAGRFDGTVMAFSDVTDLVNALTVKEEFVSSVTHELRTPLTSIMGYLDLALEDADQLPQHVSHSLTIAMRNSERLLQLVEDLLFTAAGTLSIEPRSTALAEIVAGSVASAMPRAEHAGVTLVIDAAEGLLAEIDPTRMGQVLDNLLSNAIKYSPGGGRVTVRTLEFDGAAVLEVSDTGMGMSEADQAEVFTKFFRTSSVRQAAIPGLGLGLAISKSIAEAHGGTLTFTSVLGAGTTFRVSIPQRGEEGGRPETASLSQMPA
jgi:two-component system phosphate regulon sensor histidine kinase PhoR